MIVSIVLTLLCLMMVGAAVRLFYSGLRKTGSERVLERLGQNLPEPQEQAVGVAWLDRAFLRAGMGRPGDRIGRWLLGWAFLVLAGFLIGRWAGGLLAFLLCPLVLRIVISWRFHRRVRKMIAQLPTMLDHAVRSLKSGRTLADAILGAIDASSDPLAEVMARVQRNVKLGVNLADAMQDVADLYERDELQMLALGLRINHRYGGNASELLENLIKLIREREQGARQLRAMTGETRMTAIVLALLPVSMAGYFLLANPHYLMAMWNDLSGQKMLLSAFALQALGCLALWRMLRSI